MPINLIPPQLKKARLLQKRLSLFSVVMFVVLLIAIVASAGLFLYNQYESSVLVRIRRDIDNAEQYRKRFAEVEETINTTNSKLQKINTVDNNRVLWSRILQELANSTPVQAKLKGVSLEETSKKMTLTGEAETRTDIANFKDKLEASSYFKNTIFSTSSLNESKNNYSFSITAELEKIK